MHPSNRLIHEKSPYLLQHAHNPVDWHPWSDEAFAQAKTTNKPIFLSIGYATCHWCHVMEKESFEDPEAAAELNQTFICIKVDREERPDVDALYMTVCQMLSGSGGWPLTIFMTPDKKPFFAATYLPKNSRYGRAGVIELCRQVRKLWAENPQALVSSADAVTGEVAKAFEFSKSNDGLDETVLVSATRRIHRSFDPKYGGFERAPKFPTAHRLQFLLQQYHYTRQPELLDMVTHTLTAMRHGGLWDHVGFGFHRYSTDEKWLLPHFEKMLYDQALLAMVYLEAFQITRSPLFAQTAREIFTYVLHDMTSPEGGFYTAEDADSEGEEGKYYVWTLDQWRKTLGVKTAEIWQTVLNIRSEGNFKEEATGRSTGANIPHLTRSAAAWAEQWKISPEKFQNDWEQVRRVLYTERLQRVPPLKDDKILTDWNGLMIAALAMGARVLEQPEYETAALRAAEFCWTRLRSESNRLLHRFRDGQAAIDATANDYAYFIMGLLELHRTTLNLNYLERAITLQRRMQEDFWNENQGGFFLTSAKNEELPIRPVELYDGAIPSANSVSLNNLIKLSRLTGALQWEEMAHQMTRTFAASVRSQPTAYTHFLTGLGYALGRSCEVVLVGNPTETATRTLLNSLNRHYTPGLGVVLKSDQNQNILADLARHTQPLTRQDNKPTAFVCRGANCAQPTSDITEMLELIRGHQG